MKTILTLLTLILLSDPLFAQAKPEVVIPRYSVAGFFVGDTSVPGAGIRRPLYPGGDTALQNFLMRNLQYPITAHNGSVSGNVYLAFNVETDGSVTNVRPVKGTAKPNPELEAEAIRLVGLFPKLIPGSIAGQVIPMETSILIVFILR